MIPLLRVVLAAVLLTAGFGLRAQGAAPAKPALSAADQQKVTAWMARRVAAARQPFCYRQSHGRGVGEPLSVCAAGQEKNGALCYPECKAGFHGVGPVCWGSCPAGYTDTGALCTRGADTQSLTKQTANCPAHFHNMGLSCYRPWPPKSISSSHMTCPAGMYREGGFCYKHCADGFTNTGVSCYRGPATEAKSSYGRGAGAAMRCEAGKQEDAGLCYNACPSGFHGVGPVCWQNCPAGMNDCGAGCSASHGSCAAKTVDMVVAPLMLAANIFTLGASSEITEAKAELTTALKTRQGVQKALARTLEAYATALEQMTTKEVADTLKKKFSENAVKWIAKEYGKTQLYMIEKQSNAQLAESYARDAAGLDPTGVAGVVEAFTQPRCALDEPFPDVKPLY